MGKPDDQAAKAPNLNVVAVKKPDCLVGDYATRFESRGDCGSGSGAVKLAHGKPREDAHTTPYSALARLAESGRHRE